MSKRPNILFLFPDQWRPDWLGVMDGLPLRTPNLDKLAAEGVRFTNAICNSPLCAPSRAAVASGKYYDRCGVINNEQPYPLDQPTFYQSLRDTGYHVLGCGKFDLDKPNKVWNKDGSRLVKEWGFTAGIDNEGKMDGSGSYLRHEKDAQGPYLQFLHDRGKAEAYCHEHKGPDRQKKWKDAYTTCLDEEEYCDNWLSENGLELIRNLPAGEPWFIQVNFTGPHNPMDVTARMRERWDGVSFPPPHANEQADYSDEDHQRNRQNYAAMLENIDRQVGRFLDLAKERGELENTLVVFSSDHGEMLGDHGKWGKSTWRHPALGVPLIIAGPGVRQNAVAETPLAIHDLAATFIDYAGSSPLPDADAKSLRPVLDGASEAHRDVAVGGLNDWRAAYDGRYKLVTGLDDSPLLFDLQADPWEDRTIAADHPDIVARLTAAIEAEKE